MKRLESGIALFLIACLLTLLSSKKIVPTANDLANHFGTDPIHDKYGPRPNPGYNLRREGVGPGQPVTAIDNFEDEINVSEVVSGDLSNTSADASKIISPPLAPPKAEIITQISHEAVIKTPVQLGTNVEEKTMTTMNRLTGKVDSLTVTNEKPVVGLLNTLREVKTEQKTVVDLSTGKILK